MIDHISVGVSDLERPAQFYEATLAALGLARLVTRPRTVGFGKTPIPNSASICARPCRLCHRRAACTSACERRQQARSTRFMPRLLRPAAQPTARRASARTNRVRYYAVFVVHLDSNRIETATFPAE